MFDVLSQLLKMIGIFFFWYFTFYEIPKLLKNGTFHTLYDIIKYVTSQGEYNPSDKRSKTTLSKIWLFIDKFLLTVPGLVRIILISWNLFTKAWNDLLIALQNLAN